MKFSFSTSSHKMQSIVSVASGTGGNIRANSSGVPAGTKTLSGTLRYAGNSSQSVLFMFGNNVRLWRNGIAETVS